MGTATATTPRVRQYADPFACPACSSRLPLDVTRCPSCDLILDGLLARQLLQTLRTADNQLAQLVITSRRQTAAVEPQPAPPVVPQPLPRPERRGLSDVTVPRLLLSLGALCLLVAAVIFLAVAWSWLGVGGRTAVLVGLTVVTGGLGVWLSRRDLRVAAEALTTVALGLLVLDVLGADSAGWLGDLGPTGLAATLGAIVLCAALPLALSTRLVAPQLIGAMALSVLGAGYLLDSAHESAVSGSVILGYAGLAALGGVRRLQPLAVAAAIGAAWWWLGLASYGLVEAAAHPSLRGLWVDRWGVPLLLASLLLLLPLAFTRHHAPTTRGLAAAAATLFTGVAVLPVIDESATAMGVVALTSLGIWTLAYRAVPETWRPVPLAPLVGSAVPVAIVTFSLAVQAANNAISSPAAPVAAPVLLLIGAVALAGSLLATTGLRTPVTVLLLAAVGTMALHPVPVWTIAAALVLVGVSHAAGRTTDRKLVGIGIVLLGTVVALPNDALAAGTLLVVVGLTAALLWSDSAEQRLWGGALLPLGVGGFLWLALAVVDVAETQRAVPILVAVGLIAILRPRPETELAAAATGAAAATTSTALAVDVPIALALHLTVAGVLVCASALIHRDRHDLGWIGGLLLAAASWVWLAELGMTAPEPYTLPSALALLAVGLIRMSWDVVVTTMRALGPGLMLATLPSLVWVLADPVSLRAALLGAACLGLVLVGTAKRWNAPLVVGAGVGTAIVLVELAPYALQIPQWVLIGLAGTALTVVGITWERRLRDLRAATAYVGRLR